MKKIIKYNFIIALLLSLGFNACKPDENGFGGSAKISGKVQMQDTLSASLTHVVNADVYIGFGFKPNSANYSYKAKSNELGYFEIPNLYKNGKYFLFASKTIKRGINELIYKVESEIDDVSDSTFVTLTLLTDINLDYLSGNVVIKDSLSEDLIPLINSDVYLGYGFQPNSTHFTYKLTSDVNGYFKSPYINLSDSLNYQFYVSSNIYIGSHTVVFSRRFTYTEFKSAGNTIELLPEDGIGFITIRIKDMNGTPQPNMDWCLYSNRFFFQHSIQCIGSIYSKTTNFKGMGYASWLTPGSKYYVKAYREVGGDTLWVKDSINITSALYPVFDITLQ